MARPARRRRGREGPRPRRGARRPSLGRRAVGHRQRRRPRDAVARGARHRARRRRPRGDRPRRPAATATATSCSAWAGAWRAQGSTTCSSSRATTRPRDTSASPARCSTSTRSACCPVRGQQPRRDRARRGGPRGPARSGPGGRGARPGPGLFEARGPDRLLPGLRRQPVQAGRARPRAPVPEARGEGPGGRSLRDHPGRLRPAQAGRARPVRRGAGACRCACSRTCSSSRGRPPACSPRARSRASRSRPPSRSAPSARRLARQGQGLLPRARGAPGRDRPRASGYAGAYLGGHRQGGRDRPGDRAGRRLRRG